MLPSENPWPIIIACIIVTVGLLIAWSRQKRGWLLLIALIPVVLAIGAWEYDQVVVTPREEVTEDVREIVTAFQQRNLEKTLSYISDSARDLKLLVASAYNLVELGPDTRISDIQVQMLPRNERAISVFRVNSTLRYASGSSYQPTMWEARWQPENNGWKMIDILRRDPVTGEPELIPDQWRRTLNSMYPQKN